MTQTETVQAVQTLEDLQAAGKPVLVKLMKQFKEEDTDCLQAVNSSSKKQELFEALAEHMGFNTESKEPEIKAAVDKELGNNIEVVMVGDAPKAPITEEPNLFTEPVEDSDIERTAQEQADEAGAEEMSAIDKLMAELDLDPNDMTDEQFEDAAAQAEADNAEFLATITGKKPKKPRAKKEPKEPKAKKLTIPMDAPIPVREYENLLLGIYGNVLEPLEEPTKEGYTHEEIKLERFNAKAHESFRASKGSMNLVSYIGSGSYLITRKLADGTLDPVLEVTNRGRGCLRCKQLANHLQVAYIEKQDHETISAEAYSELVSKIELLPVNLPVTKTEEVVAEA